MEVRELSITVRPEKRWDKSNSKMGSLYGTCDHPGLWLPDVRISRKVSRREHYYVFSAAVPRSEWEGRTWSLNGVAMPEPLRVNVFAKSSGFASAPGVATGYDDLGQVFEKPDDASKFTTVLYGEVPHEYVAALVHAAYGVELQRRPHYTQRQYPGWTYAAPHDVQAVIAPPKPRPGPAPEKSDQSAPAFAAYVVYDSATGRIKGFYATAADRDAATEAGYTGTLDKITVPSGERPTRWSEAENKFAPAQDSRERARKITDAMRMWSGPLTKRGGRPRVRELRDATGIRDISAAERTRRWDALQDGG